MEMRKYVKQDTHERQIISIFFLYTAARSARRDSPNMIQPQIPLDVIREIVRISRFTTVSHGKMRTECLDFVLVGFHLDDGSAGRHVGGEEDVVGA